MDISQLVVTGDTATKELYREVKGEKFYKFNITLPRCNIMAVVSEFLLKEITGKMRISGYLRSDTIKSPKEHLCTYFHVTDMVEADADEVGTDVVAISGKLAKRGKLTTLNNGRQILPIVLKRVTDDGHTSILHAILNGKDARYINSVEDVNTTYIDTFGSIQSKYGAIEVNIGSLE